MGGLRITDTSWEGVGGVEDSIVSLAGITMNHSVTVSGGHAPYASSPAVGGGMRQSPPHTCSAWRARGQQAQGDVGGIHKAVPDDVLSHLQGFQYFRADGTVADDSFPNRALPAAALEGGGGDRDSRVETEGPAEGLPLLGRLLGSSAAERAAAEKAHADVKKIRDDLASHKLPGLAHVKKHPAAGVEVRHASVYVCSVCRCVHH